MIYSIGIYLIGISSIVFAKMYLGILQIIDRNRNRDWFNITTLNESQSYLVEAIKLVESIKEITVIFD